MTYIEACNLCLAVVGESPVSDLNSPNPSLGLVRRYLDLAQDRLLSRRWWFNDIQITLQPATDGRVHVPYAVFDVYSDDGTLYSVVNSELFDIQAQSFIIGKAVNLRLSIAVAFEHLPEMSQQWVAYTAADSMYADDLGVDGNIQHVQMRIKQAWDTLFSQELRHRQYSTAKTARAKRLRSALIT